MLSMRGGVYGVDIKASSPKNTGNRDLSVQLNIMEFIGDYII